MKVLEKVDATAPLAEYTADLDKEPVIITSNGKPIAALVPLDNMDLETVSLSTNPKFLELIERSRSRHRAQGGISSDEMRRRLGLSKSQPA
jgi:antitoxin (DNA-binding transcriptional repressor) of toxin-antitoxin stability system